MSARPAAILVALLLAAGLDRPARAAPDCAGIVPPPSVPSSRRAIRAEDLLALRDFGNLPGLPAVAPSFALSPDGRSIAIELRQADPDRNRYCMALFVVPVAGGPPRLLAEGGDLIRDNAANRTMGDFPEGWPRTVAPAWSANGRSIAWLRRDAGRTAIWTVRIDGGGAQKVSDEPDDVIDLAWDGTGILFSVQPAIRLAEDELDRAGRSGWVYDDRFWVPTSDRPFPVAPFPTVIRRLDPVTHQSRAATEQEQQRFEAARPLPAIDAAHPVIAANGERAWVEPVSTRIGAPVALHVEQAGRAVACPADACRGAIVGLWWTGPRLIMLRSEGVEDRERLAVYSWRPGAGPPRQLLATNDLFQGCLVGRPDALLCAREGATQPRSIVRIDLGDGGTRIVFDPNPEFRALDLGPVERLRWRNGFGRETFGDLVLPPGHRAGQKHPLIVVQYNSRCFLRGGTGDEYPIQLLAAHGFAVLSVNRPRDFGVGQASSWAEVNRLDRAGWVDRRNVQASIETGIALAEAKGVVDADRLGITGLSDGSTATYWALNHSRLFKAAASSTCCQSPNDFFQIGPAYRAQIRAEGRPRPEEDQDGYYRTSTLQGGAATMDTPLLLQLASTEFRSSLSTVDALQRYRQPVDMLVFPDEYHIKWQPAHRLAIYRRNVCWFEYWLGRPSDICAADDLTRWALLRRPAPSTAAGAGSAGSRSPAS